MAVEIIKNCDRNYADCSVEKVVSMETSEKPFALPLGMSIYIYIYICSLLPVNNLYLVLLLLLGEIVLEEKQHKHL